MKMDIGSSNQLFGTNSMNSLSNSLSISSTNKNFKMIKKLDFKSLSQIEHPKSPNIVLSKSDIDKESSLIDKLISKDLEKYIEFLSNEDNQCDKMVNFQVPYYFLGINSKQSLSTNGKELIENNKKVKEEFFTRIEKKFASNEISTQKAPVAPVSFKKSKK